MDTGEFYNLARSYADLIRKENPALGVDDKAFLCVAETSQHDVLAGTSGFAVVNGEVEAFSAERAVIALMREKEQLRLTRLAVMSLQDNRVYQPHNDILVQLVSVEPENSGCQILLSPDETNEISGLIEGFDFFSGFEDEEPPPEEAAVDCAEGVVIDESNPFYAPDTEDTPPEHVLAPDGATAQSPDTPEKKAPEKEKKAMSKLELLRQAKQRKKVAKARFNLNKH